MNESLSVRHPGVGLVLVSLLAAVPLAGIVAVGVQSYSGVTSRQEIQLVSQSSQFEPLKAVGSQAWFNA